MEAPASPPVTLGHTLKFSDSSSQPSLSITSFHPPRQAAASCRGVQAYSAPFPSVSWVSQGPRASAVWIQDLLLLTSNRNFLLSQAMLPNPAFPASFLACGLFLPRACPKAFTSLEHHALKILTICLYPVWLMSSLPSDLPHFVSG